jgi:hypothetical protein
MKLVIIEGLDRCGKDTLISNLSTKFPQVLMRHWSFPQGDSNDAKTQWQKDTFLNEMEKWDIVKNEEYNEPLIWNRSHIGEYVYGTIYRDSKPSTWIPQMEKRYLTGNNVYLIFLYADADFLLKEDDGQSYSVNKDDKELEIKKFHEAIDKSIIINKLKIKVNDGERYITESEILNKIHEAFGF